VRITFTIDSGLVPKLKALVRRKKDPLRKIINDLLRVAINIESKSTPRGFKVKSYYLKLKDGYDPLSLNSLDDAF